MQATIPLLPAQHHYLKHVLRLSHGDRIAVFNGHNGEFEAAITELNKKQGSLMLKRQRRLPEPEPDIWLCFAPIKKTPIDYVAQKATELGVGRLVPVLTKHTVVTRVNIDRLTSNAIEAAEQTGRLSIPEISEPVSLSVLLSDWPTGRALIVADETGQGQPIASALLRCNTTASALLIGPEGGFSKDELDALRKLPQYVGVSLGKRLLRADTAAIAALSCWQALKGDWQGGEDDSRSES